MLSTCLRLSAYPFNAHLSFSKINTKENETKAMQSVINDKETRISQLEGELKQAGLDLKQLQGQLVVKEEQLLQTQENIQKVGLGLIFVLLPF